MAERRQAARFETRATAQRRAEESLAVALPVAATQTVALRRATTAAEGADGHAGGGRPRNEALSWNRHTSLSVNSFSRGRVGRNTRSVGRIDGNRGRHCDACLKPPMVLDSVVERQDLVTSHGFLPAKGSTGPFSVSGTPLLPASTRCSAEPPPFDASASLSSGGSTESTSGGEPPLRRRAQTSARRRNTAEPAKTCRNRMSLVRDILGRRGRVNRSDRATAPRRGIAGASIIAAALASPNNFALAGGGH